MSYRIKNKNYTILWPISILKFCLPFFSVFFFGQIFLLLTTIFDCQNGKTYVSNELNCRTGLWFSIEAPLTLIAMIFFVLLSLITNTLYYKSTFVKYGSDVLKKTNCYPDISLIFNKIFIIILFILDDGREEEHWIILIILMVVTGLNTFCNFIYQNRLNTRLNNLNNIFGLMPFLGFLSLFIGKIFKDLGFNGAIFLFFSWGFFGILFLLFYKKKDLDFIFVNHKEINTPGEYLNYIHKFHSIILNKNNSRNDYTILKSFLSKKEENCFCMECPLKNYMDKSANEIDEIFPLFQFCEKLFEYGIAKFPNDITLKINYSMFLIFGMNYNKKALIVLNNINTSIFSFHDNYNIYRCQRLIDEYIMNKNSNKNVMHSFEFKKKVHDFKLLVSKNTSLYYDFWTLIIINKLNMNNNIDDLNKIGSEIIKLSEKIEEEYESLIKIKPDNYDLISFYYDFTENVLNDPEKNKKGKNNIYSTIYNNTFESQEIQFSNFDVNTLKEKDLFKYFILSGNKKTLANIIDYSMNLANIFGYTKEEIIGKNINYIIPEIFHNKHNKTLLDFNNKSVLNFYKELFMNDNYIPQYLETNVYALSKSKFLIPIELKIYFVQTEGNEFAYVVEVKKTKDYQKNLENIEDYDLKCVVLTDENFYIQTFTPNCVNYLELNDSYINSNYNIINYIKQLKIQYLKKINEILKPISLSNTIKSISYLDDSGGKIPLDNNISYLEKKRIKKELIESYRSEKHEITWTLMLNNSHNKNIPSEKNIFNHSVINNKDNNYYFLSHRNKIENNYIYEEVFLLEINEIILSKELVGYYFIFHNIPKELYDSDNFISFQINQHNKLERNSITRLKKYKYLFEINPTSFQNQQSKFRCQKYVQNKRCKSPRKTISKYKSIEKIQIFKYKRIASYNGTNNDRNRSSKNVKKYKVDIVNNEDDKDKEEISEKYIPECPFNFVFDFLNRTYRPDYGIKNEKGKTLNEILKFHELNKINSSRKMTNKEPEKKRKDESSSSLESEESEQSENEDKEYSSKTKSNFCHSVEISRVKPKIQRFSSINIKKKLNNNSVIIKEVNSDNLEKKQTEHKYDIFNAIYKVNITKIHYSIYDFNKDMVVDKNMIKISKIESIIKNAQLRFSTELNSSKEYPNNLFNNIYEDIKKEYSVKNKRENNKNINKNEIINNENIIGNKIMEAINKGKEEDNSFNLNKISFFLILILIACGCIFLYYELDLYSKSVQILSLIKEIISINYCNKMGLYFIRELTLLNTPDTGIIGGFYVIIPATNRTEYISIVKKNALDLFVESQLAMAEYIKSTFKISKNSEDLLSQTKLMTKIYSNSDLKSNLVENNIIINIVQLNSAFYNLVSSTSPVQQNHADLFNFVYNSLNNFEEAIDFLLKIYMKEVNIRAKSYEIIFEIQLFVYLFIYIIIYIIAIILHSKVVERKKRYIKIFLNIDSEFISLSINKCEQFINKFKLGEDCNIKEDEIVDNFDENESLIKSDKKSKKANTPLKQRTLKSNNKRRKSVFKCTKNLIIRIFLGIFLLITYSYFFFYGFLYSMSLNRMTVDISNFYFNLQHFHLTVIKYYNIYREYLFDNGSIIKNQTPYENLIRIEKEIYASWTNDIINISYFTRTFINDNDILNQLNKSLCSYNITDYFKSQEHCANILGNSYNQDYNTFVYGFIDEIRIKKNLIRVLSEHGMIIGDLSKYEVDTWHEKYYDFLNSERGKDLTQTTQFRLGLFNDGYFHTISNIYFINVILPCLNENRKILLEKITIVGKQKTFYVIISILLILCISIYMLYWMPMVTNLNKNICETKTMLKIIPMHILMADSTINNVLHISNKK